MKKYTKDEVLQIVLEAQATITKLIMEQQSELENNDNKDNMFSFLMQAKDVALLAAFCGEIQKRLGEK